MELYFLLFSDEEFFGRKDERRDWFSFLFLLLLRHRLLGQPLLLVVVVEDGRHVLPLALEKRIKQSNIQK